MNRGQKMCLKRNRAKSLGCHGRDPLLRVCLREPSNGDIINWQCRDVIRAQVICYHDNRSLHDVPECLLVKNCPTRARRFPLPDSPGQVKLPVGQVDLDRFFFFISYISRSKNFKILGVGQVMILRKGEPCQHRQDSLPRWLIKFRTQYNTKTGPQNDDVWQTSARAWAWWGRSIKQPTSYGGHMQHRSGGGFDTPIRYMGLQLAFMLNGLYRNMPVFSEDNFLILEHKVSFGFVRIHQAY